MQKDVAKHGNRWGKEHGGFIELNLNFFLLAVVAVLFAGISMGGFAGRAAFAATPFLA